MSEEQLTDNEDHAATTEEETVTAEAATEEDRIAELEGAGQ